MCLEFPIKQFPIYIIFMRTLCVTLGVTSKQLSSFVLMISIDIIGVLIKFFYFFTLLHNKAPLVSYFIFISFIIFIKFLQNMNKLALIIFTIISIKATTSQLTYISEFEISIGNSTNLKLFIFRIVNNPTRTPKKIIRVMRGLRLK